MGKKNTAEDEFSIPIRCLVCNKCWYSEKHKQCMYGGPFLGYDKMEARGTPCSDGPKDI